MIDVQTTTTNSDHRTPPKSDQLHTNALLHDQGLGEDPGIYLPASPFTVRIHGHTLTGAGHPALGTSTRILSTDPLLVAHDLDGTPVALTGIDATRLVHDQLPNLHSVVKHA